MKKILFCVLILISLAVLNAKEIKNFKLIENSKNHYLINFSIDELELEAIDDYTKITSKSKGSTSEIGMPKLPLFSSIIQMDRENDYTVEYEVKSSRKIKDIMVFPNQRMVNGLERLTVEEKNQAFYSSIDSYPSKKVFLSSPMVMRDIDVSILSFIPFDYNPETNELEIYESVEINLIKTSSSNENEYNDRPKSRVFENIYRNHVLNYTSDNRDEDYQDPSVLYIYDGSLSSSNS